MTRNRLMWFLIELLASGFTIAGVYAGSTTLRGAVLYLISLIFWYAFAIDRRAWGLMPLNVLTTIVSTVNLVHAIR